jgi:ABC-type glycerol-3-phosphate transport system substrate-binding protein
MPKLVDILLLVATLAVISIVIFSRFSGRKNNPKPDDITITVAMQNGSIIDRNVFDALVKEFEEQNRELRILVSDDYTGAESTADIIFFDDGELDTLINNSALISLSSYFHTGVSSEQSSQWMLPLVIFMDLFFYNIDILQTVNFDRPPRTRTELLAAARAVSGAANLPAFPLALGLSDPLAMRRDIYPWIWTAGGELLDANGRLPRIAADTILFFNQLSREGLLAPESFEKTGAQRLEEFAEGKIAMLAASSLDIAFLQDKGINFGITTIPALVPGRGRLGLSGIYAGISANCAQPDEAWTFLAFIAGKSQILIETFRAVPGSYPVAFPGSFISRDLLYSKAWDIFEAVDIVEYNPADLLQKETDRMFMEQLAPVLWENVP